MSNLNKYKLTILFYINLIPLVYSQLPTLCEYRPMAEWEPVMVTFIGTTLLNGTYINPNSKAQSAIQLANLIKEVALVSKVCVACVEEYYGPGIRCGDIEKIINAWDADLQSQIIYMRTSVPSHEQGAWMQDITSQIRYSLEDNSLSLVRYKYTDSEDDAEILSVNQEIEAIIRNLAESADPDFTWSPTQYVDKVLQGGNFINDGQRLNFSTDYYESTALIPLGIQSSSSYVLDLPAQLGSATNHIDTYLRMADANTVLISSCTQENLNNPLCNIYEKVRLDFERQLYKSSNDQKINVYTLPIPNANRRMKPDGPNYVNSIIVNRKVIVPIFNETNDEIALRTYKLAMPNYEVVGVYFKDIMTLHEGGMRCLSKVIGFPFANKSYDRQNDQRVAPSSYMSTRKHFKIYPNPASSYITLTSGNENTVVEIYNTLGVKMRTVLKNNQIDISGLEAGMYLIKIHDSLNSATELLHIE